MKPHLKPEWMLLVRNGPYECTSCGHIGYTKDGYSDCCGAMLFLAECYEVAKPDPSWQELSNRLMQLRTDIEQARRDLDALRAVLDEVKERVL